MQLSEFLTACHALAQSDGNHVDKTAALAALMAALREDDPALQAACAALQAAPFSDYVGQALLSDRTCKVLLVVLEAGGVIGLHNHPHQYGFLGCISGRVRVDAYDALGEDGDMGRLRFRTSVLLGPGDHTDLTPVDRNVHRLQATAPTVLMDVFVPPLLDEHRSLCRRYEDPPPAQPQEVVQARIRPRPTTTIPGPDAG